MKSLENLSRLLAEAREEARNLGPAGQMVAAQLDEALAELRTLTSQGGRPDEGRRPEELSSANDG